MGSWIGKLVVMYDVCHLVLKIVGTSIRTWSFILAKNILACFPPKTDRVGFLLLFFSWLGASSTGIDNDESFPFCQDCHHANL